jgi:transcriptional regulator GlxA family with amidase domain
MNKSFTLLLVAATILFTNCNDKNQEVTNTNIDNKPELVEDWYNVAFLVMDGTFNTELTAPYDIFQHTKYREGIKAMNVFTVAKSLDPIRTFEGLKITPDYSYLAEDLPRIDILVIPSAEHHLDSDLEDQAMLDFVKNTAQTAIYVTSHCDGAFVLAESGLLENVESTTFPGDIETYKSRYPQLTIHEDVFFVHDGKYITSAGGAKSFEAALYLCEVLYGKQIAESLAEGLVIDWKLDDIPYVSVIN